MLADGRVLTYKEVCAHSYWDILDISDTKLFPEDGGTNAGYVDALVHENETHEPKRNIKRDPWTAKTKPVQVAEMIRLQEHAQWLIYAPGCPILARDAPQIPFGIDGMPNKQLAADLGLNPHVVDADIHSTNGCDVPEETFAVSQNYRRAVRA